MTRLVALLTPAVSLALVATQLWLYRRQRLRHPAGEAEPRDAYATSWPTRLFTWIKVPFYVLVSAALALGPWLRAEGPSVLQASLGVVLAIGGLGLFHGAMQALGRNFAPCDRAAMPFERVRSGPYRYFEHPMYSGNLLLFAGLGVANGSGPILVCTALLAVFYVFSIRDENRALEARWPDPPARPSTP